jgi:hypothetical protein
MVEGLRSAIVRALDAVADGARGQNRSMVERNVAELRERVEDLEDSLAALDSRVGRHEEKLRPWSEIRR